jgi:hypothetical protein
MDKELFEQKISQLSDEKLFELIRITKKKHNPQLFQLAEDELKRRKLTFDYVDNEISDEKENNPTSNYDLNRLNKWNWGAAILTPVWALSNRLSIWTFLWFVPFVNILVIIHLGLNGNRLAFEKNKTLTLDEFLALQKIWSAWGVRTFWILTIFGLFAGFLSIFIN